MNRIYKVIWSKVKHQYVVVSELAHSNGKQSRTARKSLRSRLATLVVCGAVAAFGVYGALPTQQAFAAEEGEIISTAPIGGLADISDYVAYRAPDDATESTNPPEGYHLVDANNPENPSQKYWVRDGFTVEFGNIPKLDGTDSVFGITNIHAPNNEDVFNQVLTDTVAVNKGTEEYTNIGEELNDVSLENLVGSTNAKNESAAEVPTNYHYYIETSEGQWENVGNTDGKTNFYNHFKTVGNELVYNEKTGKYTYNGVTVSSDNIYYIKDAETNEVNPGVFVDDEGNLYTGTVWGNTGEILATAKDEDGTFKTFWSSIADSDDIYLKDGNVTVGDINNSFSKLIENDKILKRNDIKEITVTPNDDGKGGILGLVRNGVDENENNIAVDGAITVENVGGTSGKDLGIKFSQKDENGEDILGSAFTINTGSLVEGTGTAEDTSAVEQGSLTGLTINGQHYTVPKVTVSEGGDTVNITEGNTTNIDLATTTYVDKNEKHIATNIGTNPDVKNGKFSVKDGKITLVEVDGNGMPTGNATVVDNVASASDLNEIATEASKHTTMTVNGGTEALADGTYNTDGNLQLKQTVTDGQIQYDVKLNNKVVLGDEPTESTTDKRVVLDGNTATVSIGGIDITNVDGPYLAVGDGKLKFYKDGGLSTGNEDGTFNVRPDGDLEIIGDSSSFDVEAQTGNLNAVNSSGSAIMMNDDSLALNASGNGMVISDEGITLNTNGSSVKVDRFNGATFTNTRTEKSTNINGDIVTTGTVKGLYNTKWDEDIAEEVAGSPELQSVAATQGQLQMLEEGLSDDIGDLDNLAVKYDSTDKDKVTLGGTNPDGTPAKEPVSLTNVANGAINATSTDAVNGSQLYSIQQQAEAHNTVTNGKNIVIDEAKNSNGGTEYKVSLGDNIVLGKDTSSNAVAIEGDNGRITLTGTMADGTLNQIQLDAQQNSIFLGNGMTIDGQNGIVFGMSNTEWKADDEGSYKGYDGSSTAATEGQLYDVYNTAVKYDEGSNFGTITLQGSSYSYNAANPIASGGTSITNVAYATGNDGSAAVNVDYLKDQIDAAKTEVTNADRHLNYNKDYTVDKETHKVNLEVVDNKGNVVGNTSINDVASATDLGEIGDLNSDIAHDSTGDGKVSIVDAVNNVDNKVGDLNYKHDDGSDLNYVTANDSVTDAIGDLDAAIGDLSGQVTQAEKNHTELTQGNGVVITDKGQKDEDGNITKHEYEVSLSNDITLGNADKNIHLDGNNGNISATGNISAGNVTINKDNSNLISGLSNTNWDWGKYDEGGYKGSTNAATEAQLSGAMDGVVQYDRVTDDKGNVTIDKTNITLNKGGDNVTIHNVAGGKVEQGSTDAVNGDQLYQVQQGVINNSSAINNVNNRVSSLSNRIDKVGAGAAALAALHPLDFDPDDKLSFAAGYGNYAGENAVAVGAFYQPNEDTMFSIGGTFGNDENMVNAGVSFKLGQKNNVSRSRVSMAKELVALRDEVAQLKALMAHSGVLPQGKLDTSALFPDVPENHWAYEYVHELAKLGIVEGYPDGNFEGDRMMTRYEFAAIVYRAMQKGVNVDRRMLTEFEPELKLIRVDVVARDDNGNPTIERVRVNDEATQQA